MKITREKRGVTLGHFSKEECSICVNEKIVEGEICRGKQEKENMCSKMKRERYLTGKFVSHL